MTPGERLKAWRDEQGLNQGEAARAAKVQQATWCDWENDVKRPDLANVLMLVELTKGSKAHRITPGIFTAKTVKRKNPRGPLTPAQKRARKMRRAEKKAA